MFLPGHLKLIKEGIKEMNIFWVILGLTEKYSCVFSEKWRSNYHLVSGTFPPSFALFNNNYKKHNLCRSLVANFIRERLFGLLYNDDIRNAKI